MAFDPAPALDRMRTAAPLVQNITNPVAMNTVANVMLAAGASPAMVYTPEESPDFLKIAHALSINTGTLSPTMLEAMHLAIKAAQSEQKPWVLDPVGCGSTPYRTSAAQGLADQNPTIIRGNASEIMALAGEAAKPKGVDANTEVDAAQAAAIKLATNHNCTVCVTGPIDLVTDGTRTARITNGHPLMPRVTGLGCALTGLCAAFAATTEDPFEAATAALAYYTICGEIAATATNSPGTFATLFIDALANVEPATLTAASKVTIS